MARGIFKHDVAPKSNRSKFITKEAIESLRSEILTGCDIVDGALESIDQLANVHTKYSKGFDSVDEAMAACEDINKNIANVTGKMNLPKDTFSTKNFSLESISNPLEKVSYGLEFIGTIVEKIMKKLKEFFKWLWKKVKQFFNWLTGREEEDEVKEKVDSCLKMLKNKSFTVEILRPAYYKTLENDVDIANKINFIVEYETRDFTDKDFVIKEVAKIIQDYTNFIKDLSKVSKDDFTTTYHLVKKDDEKESKEDEDMAILKAMLENLEPNIKKKLGDSYFKQKVEIFNKIKQTFGNKGLTVEGLGLSPVGNGDPKTPVIGAVRGDIITVSEYSSAFSSYNDTNSGSSRFIYINAYNISRNFKLENDKVLNDRFGKAISGLSESELKKILSNTYLNRIKSNLTEVERSRDRFLKAVEDAEKILESVSTEASKLDIDRAKVVASIAKEVMSMSSFTFKYSMSITRKEALDILLKLASTEEVKKKVKEAFDDKEKFLNEINAHIEDKEK